MFRCRFLVILFCLWILPVAIVVSADFERSDESPNILVILCDDLGYGDLACYGDAELKTPNIDRLAREGLRLTSCYAAAANCSPARTGFMTGRTPTRVGVHNWIPMFSPVHVRRQEITVATLLRNAGYDTGHFGRVPFGPAGNGPARVATDPVADLSKTPHSESEISLTTLPQSVCWHPRHVVLPQLT